MTETIEQPPAPIESTQIVDEMQRSYIDYSMSVIVGRALPDARDGMKPGARRILFAMRDLGLLHNRPYKKSAYVVGEVLGKYHPHGDSAVYDTMVRMAQPFAMRYPLVDGQGNFGSIDGDNAAAYRYTEVRLRRIAEEMLIDIDKQTVDMVKNYNGEIEEPAVLPARLPNLLLNGCTGIAVGMATNIPPHRMREITDAVIHLIDHPDAGIDDLLQHVQGPDFPTGGIICGVNPIREMYTTGRGHIKLRGRAAIEENKQGRETIIITEIPYAVNKTTLVTNIARLVREKTLDGISDIRDESSREGIRVVIELKRDAMARVILNNLFKHTQLQVTFGAILLALDHGRPRVMNLKEMLSCFIDHRIDVITRRTRFEVRKAEARAHILEGLKIAIDHLDDVVKIIRGADNRDMARTELISRYNLSLIQANAILDMRLYQLTGLEREKLDEEYLALIKHISYLRDLLANREKILELIKTDLQQIRDQYDDERLTEIVAAENELNMEDLLADTECVITISHRGYIKRVPVSTYRAQRRGGKGISGMTTRDEDYLQHIFIASTHDYILFFTGTGRLYRKKVYEIPEGSRVSLGKAIVNLLELRENEKIAAMIRVRDFEDTQHLVMATQRGIVKKTNLSAFRNARREGIIACNIDPDDELIGVRLTDGEDDLILVTHNGMSIRFPESNLRDMGRATRGVRGIRLKGENDHVVSLEKVDPRETLLVCTQNGYGKRTLFEEYRRQSRGGNGIFTIRTSERNGPVVAALSVNDEDALMMITAQGKMIRMDIAGIRPIKRVTQGVKLINLYEGDKLVCATPVDPEKDDQDGEASDPETGEPPATTPETETSPANDQATRDNGSKP